MFEVISGTWDELNGDLVANHKLSVEFPTFEEALAAYEREKARPWRSLLFNGELLTSDSNPS